MRRRIFFACLLMVTAAVGISFSMAKADEGQERFLREAFSIPETMEAVEKELIMGTQFSFLSEGEEAIKVIFEGDYVYSYTDMRGVHSDRRLLYQVPITEYLSFGKELAQRVHPAPSGCSFEAVQWFVRNEGVYIRYGVFRRDSLILSEPELMIAADQAGQLKLYSYRGYQEPDIRDTQMEETQIENLLQQKISIRFLSAEGQELDYTVQFPKIFCRSAGNQTVPYGTDLLGLSVWTWGDMPSEPWKDQIDKDTAELAKERFRAYMGDRIPENAVLSVELTGWTEFTSDYIVSYTDGEQFMALVIDDKSLEVMEYLCDTGTKYRDLAHIYWNPAQGEVPDKTEAFFQQLETAAYDGWRLNNVQEGGGMYVFVYDRMIGGYQAGTVRVFWDPAADLVFDCQYTGVTREQIDHLRKDTPALQEMIKNILENEVCYRCGWDSDYVAQDGTEGADIYFQPRYYYPVFRGEVFSVDIDKGVYQKIETGFGNEEKTFALRYSAVPYTDIAGHWAEQAIAGLHHFDILPYEGMFEPEKPMSKKEFIALVQNLSISWSMNQGRETYRDADAFTREDQVSNEPLSREEAVRLLAEGSWKAEDRPPVGTSVVTTGFSDDAQIDPVCKVSIIRYRERGIITGENGAFRPKDIITRAEAAFLLYGMML